MGLKKWFKKAVSAPKKIFKNIKKPFSKITKGIARGIAKMGKAVMRGVSQLGKKLGPLGMIGLAVAMPYAMHGLSSWIGTGAMSGMHPATGLMAKKGFLGAVGQVGNAIRTGYQVGVANIGNTWNTITNSIGGAFRKFTTGTGNIWKNISQGAKDLFNSARTTAKRFMPKWRAGQSGSVGVEGWGNPFGYADTATMTSGQAAGLLDAGAIQGSQLSGQTLGSAEGWFTKAGSAEADNFISQTINTALEPQMKLLDKNALRYMNDNIAREKLLGSHVNYQSSLDTVMNSPGTSRTFPGVDTFATEPTSYTTNLGKTLDYKLGVNPNEPTAYTFTGDKTYNSQIAKNSIAKAKKSSSVLKKAATSYLAKKSLLAPNEPNIVEPFYAMQDMTLDTQGVSYGGTDITGSYGGSLLEGVFDKNKQERIMSFYKNMNILGSS